jgi:hypothetical protein
VDGLSGFSGGPCAFCGCGLKSAAVSLGRMIGRRSSVLSLLGLTFATLTALDGCGAGQVSAAVRPKEATAAEGIGEGPCREADTGSESLVVDWKPEQHGDLELLMKGNVAILPLGGIGIAGSISAEMARGSTLDVAMIMVGKVKTTWAKVQADELKGDCDGATHFVKGAMVGAFVMQTGTKG